MKRSDLYRPSLYRPNLYRPNLRPPNLRPPNLRQPGRLRVAVVMAGLLLLASCGSVGATAQVAANPPTGTNLPGFVPGGPTTTVAGGASMPGMTGMTGTTGTTNSGHIGTATASAAPANAAAAPATANTVSIQNFAFSPAAVTVRVGTTVTWTNKDADAHTVTSSDGQLHSPVLQTGATFSHTFAQAGSYHYLCTIHPFMTAVVTVTR